MGPRGRKTVGIVGSENSGSLRLKNRGSRGDEKPCRSRFGVEVGGSPNHPPPSKQPEPP